LLAFARIVESRTPSLGIRLAAITTSIALAWLTYRLVDRPIRFGKPTRAKVLVLCGLLLITASAGYGTYASDGFAGRASIAGYHEVNNSLVANPETDPRCKAFVGRARPLFPYCRLSDVHGASTVALIGDSHAWAAFPGLAELFSSRGANLLLMANSSCPPLLGAVPGLIADDRAACVARINEILAVVTRASEIKTVLIATRGAVYITGNGYGEAGNVYRNNPIRPVGASAPAMPTDEVYLAALQRTIDTLVRSGKTVYYIAEHPEISMNPAACVNRPFKVSAPMDCRAKISVVMERQKEYLALLKRIHGATIIDPLPAFCPGGMCQVFADGRLLYADGDHLSIDGSRFLAQRVVKDSLR
jgi:hypothetical protein